MKKTVQLICLCWLTSLSWVSHAQKPVYSVGVANFQANLSMAAQLNPILAWVGKRAGVELVMKSGYNFEDMQRHLARGEYDFYLGFPALQSDIRLGLGYEVIAGLIGTAQGAIIVQANSPYQQLSDLAGQEVVMGSAGVFIANVLPTATLLEKGIAVVPRSVGNQESLVVEFKLGRFQAIAANLAGFKRLIGSSQYPYRVLWESDPIANYPLLVRTNKVPETLVKRVQQAFIDMVKDSEGREILARSNQRPGVQWAGWVEATNEDYAFAIKSYQQLSVTNVKRD